MPDGTQSFDDFLRTMKEMFAFKPFQIADELSKFANDINNAFGQGRQRIVEINKALADTTPNIVRLGGNIQDATSIITQISEASRRNVLANTENVEELYAATKVLGLGVENVKQLSNSFLDVGYAIEQVGDSLLESMKYVQSIGGNSKAVIALMTDNMDKLNRYQFEGGVQGLTKMAAQASMLRFDMNETFRLADKVLDPDGAVEVASAFQRLGVSAGNLVDPFQLMNQSINDPSGLQNSLANVAKQFTYFDEKTKSFKINPQGVLTLREIEKQTGVSAGELSKMGLAAAELDKRLSAISAAGLKIANEEDKQFISNIAKLGDKGTYEVTLKDGTKKELSELQQKEFDELIKQQREAPQTLEELARSQLTSTELLQNDANAILKTLQLGLVTTTPMLELQKNFRSLIDTVGGGYSKSITPKEVRGLMEPIAQGFETFIKDLRNPNKNLLETASDFATKLDKQIETISGAISKKFFDTTKKIGEKEIKKGNELEKSFGELMLFGSKTMQEYLNVNKATPSIDKVDKEYLKKSTKAVSEENKTSKSEVAIGGKVVVDIKLPDNFSQLSTEQQQKVLDSMFNSQQFQQMVYNIANKKETLKQPTKTSFG